MKNFIAEPDFEQMTASWLSNYDAHTYGKGLSGAVLKRSHAVLEAPFGPEMHFQKVLEVGAGTLAHLGAIRHGYEEYVASDFDQAVIDVAKKKVTSDKVRVLKLDAGALPFDDDSFDRLIATHVLEHVERPHEVLKEWVRVIKPGGVLSIVLPCDPGMAWRFGRYFGPRTRSLRAGIPYDYYMAREHINSIFGLREILAFHFPRKSEVWWPLRIPSPDLNLIYAGNFYV